MVVNPVTTCHASDTRAGLVSLGNNAQLLGGHPVLPSVAGYADRRGTEGIHTHHFVRDHNEEAPLSA
jgi:hypothetical protein